jgi:hypothetical protein
MAALSLMGQRIAARLRASNPATVKSALTLTGKVIFALTSYRTGMRRFAFLWLLALLPIAPATAAPVGAATPATATGVLTAPVSIVKTSDMDFGLIVVAAAGTVVIDPNVNSIATTGGVTRVGTQWSAARFVGSAGGSSVVVLIKIPNQPVVLTRQGGTETMSISPLTLQGQNKRSLAAMETFSFRVGGTLAVAANQAEGLYTGTFDVQIQYP